MCLKMDYENSINLSLFEEFEMDKSSSYETLYNLIKSNENEFRRGRYKIAYGYVITSTKLSFRHCFFIDVLTNKIIDPSYLNFIDSPIDARKCRYEVFTEFKCLEEYFFAIRFSSHMAKEEEKTLQRLLQDEENILLKKITNKNNQEKQDLVPIIIAV